MDEQRITTFNNHEETFHLDHVIRQQEYSKSEHYHDSYEIYYLLQGTRLFFIHDRLYELTAGDLVFINSNEIHRTMENGCPGHERLVINFKSSFLEPYVEDWPSIETFFIEKGHVIRLLEEKKLFIRMLFEQISLEITNCDTGYLSYLRALLTKLLLFGVRRADRKQSSSAELLAHPLDRKIIEIVRYINTHYPQTLSLDQLAKSFYISSSYLCRSFRRVTGFSFIHYVNMTRVKEAMRLLRYTDMKIIDIANAVGFNNLTHFNRIFKTHTNISPKNYRKIQHSGL
jgi:AraC-like DNA-binding protein